MTEAVQKSGGGGRVLVWIFAGVGLLAALAVIALAVMAAGLSFRGPHRDPASVAVRGSPEPYSVQDVRDVYRTGLVQIAIGIPGGGGGGSYASGGKYQFDHRNLILLDKATGSSRRLLADNSRRIVEFRFFPAVAAAEGAEHGRDEYVVESVEDDGKTEKPPAAYYVLAVRQPGPAGREDVLIGNLGTARQAFVLRNIDGIDRMWMLTPTRLAMVVREGMKVQYKVIDVPTLKIVLARPVEIG